MKSWVTIAAAACAFSAHAGDFVFFDQFEASLHPVTGSVIVSEIMSNPMLVSDAAGEWFELANVSDQTVDLGGCTVKQNASEDTLPAYALAAGSFAVAARNSELASNGNVTAFATFTFGLASTGTIDLNCDGRLIDEVTWPGESQGHSRSLYPQYFSASGNDDVVFGWCYTTQLYNAMDTGSPNAANELCPAG